MLDKQETDTSRPFIEWVLLPKQKPGCTKLLEVYCRCWRIAFIAAPKFLLHLGKL
jgi:hypothetical protein